MLVKFDSKSNRVKGLSFHPKRPWILASLHNGIIQLWDYRMGVMLDRYEEHDGPVRGVDFHRSQPMFVSGGDDYKIKVWNYKLRRCLFTLLGHLDYIRTVQFHHEYPWIVSASDDQTIRIWNWQSRTCLTVLTGHNHYVMSASFHPREDLIVSASLDLTVRVWDTSGLRRKTVRSAPGGGGGDDPFASRTNPDLFGAGDAIVKHVLEGHDRGVNWASFSPTQAMFASGADDRQIKLWRMSDTRAWEWDTLRGHTQNVSCVMFHPKHDLLISNSEDKSIRVWDVQKRMCIQTFRRDADRYWILAVHPEQSLIAAGHDNGMLVFKLERERPAYAPHDGHLYYVKDRYLRRAGLGMSTDSPIISLRTRATGLGSAPRQLLINNHSPDEECVLLVSALEGGSYELYNLALSAEQEPGRGQCLAAAFTGRHKFAVLDKTRQIVVRGLTNDAGKRIRPPYPNADFIFPAATAGRILVRGEDRICLFELQSRRVVAEITSLLVKYVVWSKDGNYVALIGKHTILLADRDLTQICGISETVRVKSGVWDDNGVFVYTTLNHIKYLLPLPTADNGIVRTLDVPVYAAECRGGALYVMDRDAKVRTIPVDATEHQFKLALARKQFDRVLSIIRTARLCGQSVIAYLQKSGFPEFALIFVDDEATKFNLALECGNIDIALKAAKALGKEEVWHRLAEAALHHGNFDIVETAYQSVKAFDKLSFLYLVTGNHEKLAKMLTIANLRNDTQSRFHNALYLGNVEERVKCLEAAGQTALAYTTAATYGLDVEAARLKACLEEGGLPVPVVNAAGAKLLLPATPLIRNCGNWPTVPPVTKGVFDPATIAAIAAAAKEGAAAGGKAGAGYATVDAAAAAAAAVAKAAAEAAAAAAAAEAKARAATAVAAGVAQGHVGSGEGGGESGWGDDLDLGLEEEEAPKATGGAGGGGGGGWGDEDLDLGDLGEVEGEAEVGGKGVAGASGKRGFQPPPPGTSVPAYWIANSPVAGDHIAAGNFEHAMTLLNRQIGLVNFHPLKPWFLRVWQGARGSVPTLPSLPSVLVFFHRSDVESPPPKERTLPCIVATPALVQERMVALTTAFTDARFNDAAALCDALYAIIPCVVVSSRSDAADLKAALTMVTEYKLALRLIITAKATDPADVVRQMELSAYTTHCSLDAAHIMLTINLAMAMAFKHKNFITASGFAKRLLEMPDIHSAKNSNILNRAKMVLQKSSAEGRNAHRLDYDDTVQFKVCAASLTPIYRGTPFVRSPYSGAFYKPEYKGSVCVLDGMAQVGLETVGLVSSSAASAAGGPSGGASGGAGGR